MCEGRRQAERERKARFDRTRPSSSTRGCDSNWERARAAFLARHGLCAKCPAEATTVDHKIPHRGDLTLFWDPRNWQPLCASCHNSAKQREERRDHPSGPNWSR